MFVDTRPRKRNAPRPAEKSCPKYLQWLRGRECLARGRGGCEGKIEAAHVDYAGGKGMGTKVADRYAIPLCSTHHLEQHRNGWRKFERDHFGREGHGLNAANAYWYGWPGRLAWEAKNA